MNESDEVVPHRESLGNPRNSDSENGDFTLPNPLDNSLYALKWTLWIVGVLVGVTFMTWCIVGLVKPTQGYFASRRFQELVEARATKELSTEELIAECVAIAEAHPSSEVGWEAATYLVGNWPLTPEARRGFGIMAERANELPIGSLAHFLAGNHFLSMHHPGSETYHFATVLLKRAKANLNHPRTGQLLTEVFVICAPQKSNDQIPMELREAARHIADDHASSPDIANFGLVLSQQVDETGQLITRSPEWSAEFEPHLRKILAKNQDRCVAMCTHFGLASVVLAGGKERMKEARVLFEDFMLRYDGLLQYPATVLEQELRTKAEDILDGLESSAP